MSFQVEKLVRDGEVGRALAKNEYDVLLALSWFANDQGECWPSMAEIALQARVSVRSARIGIRALECQGLLVTTVRRGRHSESFYNSNLYTICLSALAVNRQHLPIINRQDVPIYEEGKSANPASKSANRVGKSAELLPNNYHIELPIELPQESRGGNFDEAWEKWPARHGKKLHKSKALDQWRRIPPKDYPSVLVGIHNFAVSDQATRGYPPDLFRWLRDKGWLDWQEPEAPVAGKNGRHERDYSFERRIFPEVFANEQK